MVYSFCLSQGVSEPQVLQIPLCVFAFTSESSMSTQGEGKHGWKSSQKTKPPLQLFLLHLSGQILCWQWKLDQFTALRAVIFFFYILGQFPDISAAFEIYC